MDRRPLVKRATALAHAREANALALKVKTNERKIGEKCTNRRENGIERVIGREAPPETGNEEESGVEAGIEDIEMIGEIGKERVLAPATAVAAVLLLLPLPLPLINVAAAIDAETMRDAEKRRGEEAARGTDIDDNLLIFLIVLCFFLIFFF
uniref:Uncharacterized protein n=1 Tax=Caenorhabditis tropicalis TaxID=1561998 RepID=A0A1I7UGV6_9PELO